MTGMIDTSRQRVHPQACGSLWASELLRGSLAQGTEAGGLSSMLAGQRAQPWCVSTASTPDWRKKLGGHKWSSGLTQGAAQVTQHGIGLVQGEVSVLELGQLPIHLEGDMVP